MAEVNLLPSLIKQACEELALPFEFVTDNKMVIKILFPNGPHYLINSNLGLLSSSEAQLCLDKAYQAEALTTHVRLPRTKSYLDPQNRFGHQSKFSTLKQIGDDALTNLKLPVIVKMNSGSQGQGVFLCQTNQELKTAIDTIFNHKSWDYDHVLVVQEYIKPKAEFRAVYYKKKLELFYHKDNRNALFAGNLSPLHFTNAKAIDVTSQSLSKAVDDFIQPIFKQINLKYAGFDLILDEQDRWWLIEINSAPGFAYYLQHNSREKVLKLFKKIFTDLNHEN